MKTAKARIVRLAFDCTEDGCNGYMTGKGWDSTTATAMDDVRPGQVITCDECGAKARVPSIASRLS